MEKFLHDVLNQALRTWLKFISTPQKYMGHKYNIESDTKSLEEMQKYDLTGVSTAMLLRAFIEEWTINASYSANELLNRPDTVESNVKDMREIIAILEDPYIRNPVNTFMEMLANALKEYGVETKQASELLTDRFSLAYIRRDAFIAINKLDYHQFTKGNPSKEPIKYEKNIFQFWNINSAVRALAAMPISAVVLCLIRDPHAYSSYFIFAIKNGENISILTDKDLLVHPIQNEMRRRPDRLFEDRVFRYHFPYELMNWSVTEKGSVVIPEQTGLVLYNTQAIKLGKMHQVSAVSMAWLTMMLALIKEKYWFNNYQADKLSYTGEMVVFPKALCNANQNLVIHQKDLLTFPKLSLKEIRTKTLTKENQWERKPTKHNEWLYQRYKKDIPQEALNVIGPKNKLLNPSGTTIQVVDGCRGLDPTTFGTADQLLRDYKWIARYNAATYIDKLALEEYEKEKDSVFKWYTDNVKKEYLINAAAKGTLNSIILTSHPNKCFDHTYRKEQNVLTIKWSPKRIKPYGWWDGVWLGGWSSIKDCRTCYLTGKSTSVFVRIRVDTPETIALVCGCTISDLPEVLQHYQKEDPYSGNHILDRLDPMDWIVNNPWKKLNLDVFITFGKRAYNNLRKQLGLNIFKSTDWDKLREKES